MAKSKNTQENLAQETQNEQEALESTKEAQQSPSENPSQESNTSGQDSSQENNAQESNPAQNTSDENNTEQSPSESNNKGEGVKDFNERLNSALDASVEWRGQTRFSPPAMQEISLAFFAPDENSQTSIKNTNDALEKLATSTARIDELAAQIAKTIAQARKDFERMQEQANTTLEDAKAAAQVTTTNATTTNENLKATEAIWDKTREMGQEIIRKETIIIEAFEKFKALQSMLDNAQTLKAELDSKLEAHRSALNADKEGYETELNQKKDEISRTLGALASGKQEALNALSETKNQALEAKINELNAQLETHKAEIQSARDLLAKDHDSLKSEILEALKEHLAQQDTAQDTTQNAQ